jgi:cytochrome c oxidase accessory protein FixG
MREQVCTYMCPWPRIQAAMVDEHSLQVTYRRDRGEPRGSHKKGASWEGRGDCIDCNQCVVACPMGIDIRHGAQNACINCALCIDACDEIMVKIERPTGLIAYDTDAAITAREAGRKAVYRLIRPRTVFYTAALAMTAGLIAYGLATRPTLDLHVARDRSPLFVRLHDGSVRNGYTLRIDNRTFEPQGYSLNLVGIEGALIKTPGTQTAAASAAVLVEPDTSRSLRVLVTAPAGSTGQAMTKARFELVGAEGRRAVPTVFAAPGDAP